MSEGIAMSMRKLSLFLERWQSDVCNYVPRLLALIHPHRGIKPVLFIDNVDQLASVYQAQIFLLAQRITQQTDSITIIALREESYYTASVQRTFTASTNHKFHIASPRFLHLIRNRIEYSRELLKMDGTKTVVVQGQDSTSRDDISDFLTIAEDSILEGSKHIVYFVDALCFGNMRLALQMFTTFLASGVTDVGKMLYIYRREGRYIIAYHEFIKSIMLGDRKYYKETASPILNVFDCGIQKTQVILRRYDCLDSLWAAVDRIRRKDAAILMLVERLPHLKMSSITLKTLRRL